MINILVSIQCITYNHEKYISDAIESFLMQKTNFQYEILIGEDCSTDNTRKIVEKYANKYPDKIRLITSEKNVGIKMNEKRLRDSSRGKYIALCEGDDYWTDPCKLQKQVDYMENHIECSMCFHAADRVKTNREPLGDFLGPYGKGNAIYKLSDIGGSFLATASKMYVKCLMDNPPEWYFVGEAGDFSSTLIILDKGYAYYIDEVMSAYRVGVEGSCNDRLKKENNSIEKMEDYYKLRIVTLNKFNEYTMFRHNKAIKKFNLASELEILILKGKIKDKIKGFKNLQSKGYFDSVKMKEKIKIHFRCYTPKIYKMLVDIKTHIEKGRRR